MRKKMKIILRERKTGKMVLVLKDDVKPKKEEDLRKGGKEK